MMNTTGSTSRLAPTANRQFFQWAVKWFYGNETAINAPVKPDLPSITGLLQALGFKLRKFGEKEQLSQDVQDDLKNGNIQIVIQCGTSKMQAILHMDNVKCECPDINLTKNDSFSSTTESAPTQNSNDSIINKIDESGNSLLPKPSKEVTSIVHDITYKLLQMINNKDDTRSARNSDVNNTTITKSTEINKDLVRSCTDINDNNYNPRTIALTTSNLVSTKFNSAERITNLQRQRNYDLEDRIECIDEPRPSPAKVEISPITHQPCTSLGEISIESEDEIYNLADYVVKAHQILEKAITHIIKVLPISSSSFYEEELTMKPAAPPLPNGRLKANDPMKKKSSMSSNASSQQSLARSLSSRTTSSFDTSSSSQHQVKHVTRRNAATKSLLPNTRDRAASCGSVPKTLTLATNARRKSAAALPSAEEELTMKPAAPPLPNGRLKANDPMKKKSSMSSNASSQQSLARSLSSRTTSSSDTTSSSQHQVKHVTRRNAATKSLLPNTRDRAASCGSVPKTLTLAANARRKSAAALPSAAQCSTASSVSKLPTSKTGQIRTANHLTVSERGMLSDCKKSRVAQGHVSLIKSPSRIPKLSTSISVIPPSYATLPRKK